MSSQLLRSDLTSPIHILLLGVAAIRVERRGARATWGCFTQKCNCGLELGISSAELLRHSVTRTRTAVLGTVPAIKLRPSQTRT